MQLLITGAMQMKAAVYGAHGLELRDIGKPRIQPSQILVRVRYASLNRRDLTRAKGDEGTVPGLDYSGEIAELGAEVTGFKTGDPVMCLAGGGYAEYAVAEPGQSMVLPKGLSMEAAATLPAALLTMHDALLTNAALKPGETVLIQGASSGV